MKSKLILLLYIVCAFLSITYAQTPITPTDASTGISQALTQVTGTDFDDGNGNGPYDVEFSSDPGFGSIPASISNIAITNLLLPALNYNTTYYWRVRDTDTDGAGLDGPWHSYSFITILATPVLTAPANATTGQSITPSLSWTLAASTSNVQFYIDYDDDGELVVDKTTVGPFSSSPQSLAGLNYNSTYTWQVRAVVTAGPPNAGETTTSSSFTFSTIPPPPTLTAPSPVNYAVGVTVLPSLAWLGVGTTYDFEFDDNSDFSSPLVTQSSAGTTFDFLPYVSTASTILSNNTLYYWRVRQTNGNGTSNWVQREFTTVSAAIPVITTLYPSRNSVNVVWYPSPYASGLKYDILLSTNSNMSSYTTPATGLTNTNYTINGLIAGTTYYIQIVSHTGSGPYVYYSFSTVNTFTTLGIPNVYLSYPSRGATVYSNPSTVYYYSGSYFPSLQYQVRYSLNSSVDGFGMLNSGAVSLALNSDLFVTLPLLTAGQTYYWQVRAYDGVTYGSWSSVESFVIYSTTPSTPIVPYPSYPTTGSTVYLNPPSFYWYLGTYATGLEFYVEWDDASDFITPLGNSGWVSNLYFTLPSNLTPGSTYYWHVKSRLASPPNTQSAYSTTQSFDMATTAYGGATQPYPTSPSGGISVGTPLASTTLNWAAYSTATLEYQVRISPYASTDGNGMLNHPTATASGWISGTYITAGSIPFTLTAGATYYWQLRSRLQSTPAVMSSWSYVVYFVTAAGSFAVVPMVGSPSHGQPINSSSAILTWSIPTKSDSHLQYDVEYSKDKEFNNSSMIQNIDEPVVNVSGLEPKSTYYWRVLSKNANGSISNYSEVGSFNTDAVTAVEQKEEVPTLFTLDQNYPNPFNPNTQIRFSLSQNSFVAIKIYDMLGQEVKTLINEQMSAGIHSTNWNGENNLGRKVASGTYVYRISAGNFVSTKKMVLIK